MIEEMEAELIESSEMDSKTDNLEVTEEADVDVVDGIWKIAKGLPPLKGSKLSKKSQGKKEKTKKTI